MTKKKDDLKTLEDSGFSARLDFLLGLLLGLLLFGGSFQPTSVKDKGD